MVRLTPLEIAARAYYGNDHAGLWTWEKLPESSRYAQMLDMRAALLALADAEPTQDMYLAGDKAQDCEESATAIAKAYIRAAAEETIT